MTERDGSTVLISTNLDLIRFAGEIQRNVRFRESFIRIADDNRRITTLCAAEVDSVLVIVGNGQIVNKQNAITGCGFCIGLDGQ